MIPKRVPVPEATWMVSVPLKVMPFDALTPEAKANVVPSPILRLLEPNPSLLLKRRVPAEMVLIVLKVLVPCRLSVPAPVFVKMPVPPMVPERVAVPVATLILFSPFKEIGLEAFTPSATARMVESAILRELVPNPVLLLKRRVPAEIEVVPL